MAEHKLIKHGTGPGTWGMCSCDAWAWLGTYEGPKGRLTKLRHAHTEHVHIVRQDAIHAKSCPICQGRDPYCPECI